MKSIIFDKISLHTYNTPSFNFKDCYQITQKEFVNKANKLFEKYKIKIPNNFFDKYQKQKGNRKIISFPHIPFIKCINSCIILEEEFKKDVSKTIKRELIKQNDIYHACSISMIALNYLKKGSDIIIPYEKDGKYNPDLIIDKLNCEIKGIQASDFTYDINPETGESRNLSLSNDLCYDIGVFIKNRMKKGVRQSDVLFGDLSQKAVGRVFMLANIGKHTISQLELPSIKKYRVIFFTRGYINCQGFYIDIQPELWNEIKEKKKPYKKVISTTKNREN